MLTNKQVCDKFWNGESGKSRSMSSDGNKLFSYDTVIAQRDKVISFVVGNKSRYSNTTSKHQVYANLYRCDIVLSHIPIGTGDLIVFLVDKTNSIVDKTNSISGG